MSALARTARRYVEAARRRISAPPEEREQRVLFLFCGKSHAWREPGRRLYRHEPLFREAIDAADATVRETMGFSPSAAFSGAWLPTVWEEEVRTEIVTMALAQMGIADLWRAAFEVEPGYLGLSGGEVAATYAAGILSREQAVRTICAIATYLRHPVGRSHGFGLGTDARTAQWLCRSAPHPIEFGGEIVLGMSQVRCEPADVAASRAFLAERVPILAEHPTSYRYHVPEMGVDEPGFSATLPFTASSASHAPLYLCSFGGRVPEGFAFDWKHWAWMVSSPYRMAAASSAACRDGFNQLVIASSATIGNWHLETARRVRQPCRSIDIFAAGAANPWDAVTGGLDRARLAGAKVRTPDTAIDLAAPEHLAAPYAAYEALRSGGPVHYLPHQDFWIVLGHAEVRAACADTASFSNQPYDEVDAVLIGRDPPDHAAVRRTISRLFDPATINRLQRHASDLAAALLQPRLDAVTGYATPFAHGIAAELIGLDAAGLAAVLAASEESRRETHRPFQALTTALDRLAPRARAYHRIQDTDEALVDPEVRSLVRFLWLASITTTERVISRAAMLLVERPELLALLRTDRSLVVPFVEEVLRLYPPEHLLPRRTTRATMLGGVEIPADAQVRLCTPAANRDPAVFDRPGEFRLDRRVNHLSFGRGAHHCSGTALARRVIPIAVNALVDAPGLRMIQPLETIEWFETVATRVPNGFVIGT